MNKPKLIFATHNANKLAEAARILSNYYEVVGLAEMGFTADIPETATTLHGNAAIKAQIVWEEFCLPCFSDDSGLMVDALGVEPGVYSARYAGPQANAQANMNLLLEKLEGVEERTAKFVTVIAFIRAGVLYPFSGEVEGVITQVPRGDGGFGYDPIFQPSGHLNTFAEMDPSQKNTMSHRARALQKFIAFLET